jgi:hypothetical protein
MERNSRGDRNNGTTSKGAGDGQAPVDPVNERPSHGLRYILQIFGKHTDRDLIETSLASVISIVFIA